MICFICINYCCSIMLCVGELVLFFIVLGKKKGVFCIGVLVVIRWNVFVRFS